MASSPRSAVMEGIPRLIFSSIIGISLSATPPHWSGSKSARLVPYEAELVQMFTAPPFDLRSHRARRSWAAVTPSPSRHSTSLVLTAPPESRLRFRADAGDLECHPGGGAGGVWMSGSVPAI